MKKNLLIFVVIGLLVAALFFAIRIALKLEKENARLQSNTAELLFDKAGAEDSYRTLSLRMEELRMLNDSLTKRALAVADSLKIKDRKVVGVAGITARYRYSDTIFLRDTVFLSNPLPRLDTIIEDKWMRLKVGLVPPSGILTEVEARSNLSVIFHNERVTIKPPKKSAFLRFFQRKHTVVTARVVEDNPYIRIGEARFVHVIE